MKSLSEIDTLAKRASRGAGFSWGISEEVGKNIKLLEMFSLPGIKNLNYYYKLRKNKNFENLNLISNENKTNKLEFCPIISGVSFLDQVKTFEDSNELLFEKIAFPLLFLPFVSRASEIIGKKILLNIDGKDFLLNFNNSIFTNSLKNGIIEIGNVVSIKFLENSDLFSINEWNELYKLSENTFVEESESLKESGAGAGLTDND